MTSLLLWTWFMLAGGTAFWGVRSQPQAPLLPASELSDMCALRSTCSSCLAIPDCSWCSKKDFPRGQPRCDSEQVLRSEGCSEGDLVNPKNAIQELKDEDFSTSGSPIQMKPQEVHLTLRPKIPLTFEIAFQQAEDYPVDLYYLMDATISMLQHKQKLAELGHLLADSMNGITKNFRMGFGSFVDKAVMPFTNMVPEKLKNPCSGYQDNLQCESPYGFRNHLPLNDNVSRFTEEVSKAPISGNLDNAEGGFDAVMQVIVCHDAIRWNEYSRKIVLFATDSIFHYAGDGKLAGIVKPNDGACHLDGNGYYTQSVHQDYPTLSQINEKITEHKVNIIFAVPDNQLPLYERLTPLVEGSHAGVLADDSSNIVSLIQDQYNAIRSTVELRDNAPDFLRVKYSSSCSGSRDDPVQQTHICGNVDKGETVKFQVQVELLRCPSTKELQQWNSTLLISPVGIREYVRLEIEMLCRCDCEAPDQQEEGSSECSESGTLTCGVCECHANRFGPRCECEGDDAAESDKKALCFESNTSKAVCSGRGECICGECNCYQESFTGPFCECDTFSCPRDDEGQLCGGKSHGKCCHERCICTPDWTGEACDCSTSQIDCATPTDEDPEQVCSGRGKCRCGTCYCEKNDRGWFGGSKCEDCSTCEGLCSELLPCVQCRVFDSGTLEAVDCSNQCTMNITTVHDLQEDASSDDKKCVFKDDSDDCLIHYKYTYDKKGRPQVRVRHNKDCPQQVEMWLIIGGVAGSVFLVGLIIILVCRLCIYLKDRRDYLRFKEQTKNPKFAMEKSPIYKEAISEFRNPTYAPGENS